MYWNFLQALEEPSGAGLTLTWDVLKYIIDYLLVTGD